MQAKNANLTIIYDPNVTKNYPFTIYFDLYDSQGYPLTYSDPILS